MNERTRACVRLFEFERHTALWPYLVTVTRQRGAERGFGSIARVRPSGALLLLDDTWREISGTDDADYMRVYEELCDHARALLATDVATEGGQCE